MSGSHTAASFAALAACLKRLDRLGLAISGHSFVELQHDHDVYRGGRASLHCLSFSAAICRAYQPAMNAAKAMANSRSALVMLAYNTTAPARSCDFKP